MIITMRSSMKRASRKTGSIHHHRHPEGVVYRSCCINSSTFAASKVTSRRWWCIEYVFPAGGEPKTACAQSTRSRISEGLGQEADSYGRFPKFHCVFVGPRPWHIEIRHRVKQTSTINLLGFETQIEKLKIEIMETDRSMFVCLARTHTHTQHDAAYQQISKTTSTQEAGS